MIFKVKSNPEVLDVGEIVAFVTGKTSINTYPSYLRIGKGLQVEELSTGRIWNPYSQQIIKVADGIEIFGIKATIELTNKV